MSTPSAPFFDGALMGMEHQGTARGPRSIGYDIGKILEEIRRVEADPEATMKRSTMLLIPEALAFMHRRMVEQYNRAEDFKETIKALHKTPEEK